MQTIVAETTKPPAYPFIIHQCQRAQQPEQKTTEPTQLSPGQLDHPSQIVSKTFRYRFRSRYRRFPQVRFGEPVSRSNNQNPQAQNAKIVIKTSNLHVSLINP